jgi:predicted GNAT family acetyltransferase
MYFVNFNAPRVVAFTDPKVFQERTARFLTMREGENSYLLGMLPNMVAGGPREGLSLFTVEEDNSIVAAGICMPNRTMCMTWATHDVIELVADHLCKAKCELRHIHGPAHVAWYMGRMYAERMGMRSVLGRAERVYQLARSYYALPSQGHLEVAVPADRPLVREWMKGFVEEAAFELEERGTIDMLVDALVNPRLLYLWKSPEPVSMAAWVAPTAHGASINFVYTPPEFRGQGYGKAVSAALGSQMLASGLRYCFILTDINDERTNGMYQSIGARTLCEFMRCSILPKEPATPAKTGLNVVNAVMR